MAEPDPVDGVGDLPENVAAEMAAATARLPERQREALALREALRLSHEQIGQVMGLEAAAVAPLLARARLRLRTRTARSAAARCRASATRPNGRCGSSPAVRTQSR